MSADNPDLEGFVRIINPYTFEGTVNIRAIDDSGQVFGPVTASLDRLETINFNSGDLESGNAIKKLFGGVGNGVGNWRLELISEVAIMPRAYVRTGDGFVTSMHEVAGKKQIGSDVYHHVTFFNPARNSRQQSLLRLINSGDSTVNIKIFGRDDSGRRSAGEVGVTLVAGAACIVGAQGLETETEGPFDNCRTSGQLGTGVGKWQLFVSPEHPIQVMSLLLSPTGNLSNLSR